MPKSTPKRQVNMADIAKELGVAQSTVSRALRNDPQVSKTLSKKIAKKAQDMGYRPNPYVAACMAQVRGYRRKPIGATIAILDCATGNTPMTDSQAHYANGAKKRAEELGFHAEFFTLKDIEHSFSALNRILWARSISGLLILPVPENFSVSEINFEHLASATLDTSLQEPILHRATSDYFNAMQTAYKALTAKGYKRIGFCTFEVELARIGDRWLGAFYGEQALAQVDHISHFCSTNWEISDFDAWLQKYQPDAIISNGGVYERWLTQLNYRIPEDIALATLNAKDLSGHISGIDQKPQKVGVAGIDLIVAQINCNDYGLPTLPKSVSIKSSWYEGTSTPDVKDKVLQHA